MFLPVPAREFLRAQWEGLELGEDGIRRQNRLRADPYGNETVETKDGPGGLVSSDH